MLRLRTTISHDGHVGVTMSSNAAAGEERIVIERAYEPVDRSRTRVLVDRLWPRGVSKADAAIDEWLRDVAPSTELRRWYAHDVERFAEFSRRYRAELDEPPGAAAVVHLAELAAAHPVALVTATRDVEHSGAQVLCDRLLDHLATPPA